MQWLRWSCCTLEMLLRWRCYYVEHVATLEVCWRCCHVGDVATLEMLLDWKCCYVTATLKFDKGGKNNSIDLGNWVRARTKWNTAIFYHMFLRPSKAVCPVHYGIWDVVVKVHQALKPSDAFKTFKTALWMQKKNTICISPMVLFEIMTFQSLVIKWQS